MASGTVVGGLDIRGAIKPYEKILTPEACAFVANLSRQFTPRREALLETRRARKARYDAGEKPDFLPETQHIRDSDWQVAPIPSNLVDRRIEIAGPVQRKMIINALNSGAQVFMADFEDATSPSWANLMDGQVNLFDAITGDIRYEDPARGKVYELEDNPAVLMVRPRGLHLPENHLYLDGAPIPGAWVDFGFYFFHNAKRLLDQGSGPYFYLPKLESHHEAALWNGVFAWAEGELGLPTACIRATVLIETLPAAFEMDEILYALRDRSAGLNCGRWDYIFSYIKTFSAHADFILPDRSDVSMEQPCMRAYTQWVVRTCHRRGIHAIGGMAAQIPIRSDAEANAIALAKVRADKEREVRDGHDGTWVAHPDLVPVAREVFDAHMKTPNQIEKRRDDLKISPADLLQVPQGNRTEAGLRTNINVALQYLAAWLSGRGCVPLHHLMEDAATAEISRAQVWQWLHHRVTVEGEALTPERFERIVDEEAQMISRQMGPMQEDSNAFASARKLFVDLCLKPQLDPFFTNAGYASLAQPTP